ncbi:MAG TPA: S66 peptidase family protein, partial [Spirochaetia bacterium]|nr:S66 peptidase family protein [Spirochaetia bacterium]
MQQFLPKRLKRGDTVAILTVSWGGPAAYPALFERGVANLTNLFGFTVRELPTTRMTSDELSKNPRLRAEDVNSAFRDSEISAIISSIGGYDSMRILPYIDPVAIIENPKIMMGYSDTTTILSFANLLGAVTFYGPSVMGGLAQVDNMPPGYLDHITRFLTGVCADYRYSWFESWSDGYPDWVAAATLGQVSNKRENKEGWQWVQGKGVIEGQLWGGCIEVLEFLKGTDYWPDADFWNERILFFETSEDKPPVREVVYMLRNYGLQHAFDRASAIFFGRPKSYSDAEKGDLYR